MINLYNVLVATDFDDASGAALEYGRALAGAFHAKLHVLHVVQDALLTAYSSEFYVPPDPNVQHELNESARKQLDRLLPDDGNGPAAKRVLRMSSTPARAIVEYARDAEIDLIVMGTHGRKAVTHLLMGSVAERVVRSAPCPVLTVHHPQHEFVVPDTLVPVTRAS